MDMKVTKVEPLGKLIDKLDLLREKKREAAEKLKACETEYDALSQTLLERLQTEGMDKATGKKATISVSKTIVANIVDFDALAKYVKRTGFFHLFQRRISDPAFRELYESKGVVPGLEPFTKVKLNHSSLKE
jgi:hypothetical protein